jgi:hypothetical protein
MEKTGSRGRVVPVQGVRGPRGTNVSAYVYGAVCNQVAIVPHAGGKCRLLGTYALPALPRFRFAPRLASRFEDDGEALDRGDGVSRYRFAVGADAEPPGEGMQHVEAVRARPTCRRGGQPRDRSGAGELEIDDVAEGAALRRLDRAADEAADGEARGLSVRARRACARLRRGASRRCCPPGVDAQGVTRHARGAWWTCRGAWLDNGRACRRHARQALTRTQRRRGVPRPGSVGSS